MYRIEDGITQSLLSSFLQCKARTAFILNGWESTAPRIALERGTLVHRILQDVHEAARENRPLDGIIEGRVDEALKATRERSWGPEVYEAFREECIKFRGVLRAYLREYADDDEKTWTEVEPVFDVEWNGFRLRGRIDGVYRDKRGAEWLLESKTFSRDEAGFDDSLMMDQQCLFYLTAHPAKGVCYDRIRSPQLRQKKGEDVAGFLARVEKDAYERGDFYFQRYEVRYPKAVVDEFQADLEEDLDEFEAWARGDMHPKKNRTACRGRYPCPFQAACATGSMAGYAQTRKLFRELEEEDGDGGQQGKTKGRGKGKTQARGKARKK